jgi:ABC-type phosphate transport system auxiliary subunit
MSHRRSVHPNAIISEHLVQEAVGDIVSKRKLVRATPRTIETIARRVVELSASDIAALHEQNADLLRKNRVLQLKLSAALQTCEAMQESLNRFEKEEPKLRDKLSSLSSERDRLWLDNRRFKPILWGLLYVRTKH